MDTYILRLGQIHYEIQTNIFWICWAAEASKCIKSVACLFGWQRTVLHFAVWTNTFFQFVKYILQFLEIQFAIKTDTFCNLDEYILHLISGLLVRSTENRAAFWEFWCVARIPSIKRYAAWLLSGFKIIFLGNTCGYPYLHLLDCF